MVKKGPCLHCGINSATPLWRNGPDEKPVLCNACGLRYSLKGHLDNYLPKNAQLQLCLNNSESANDRSNLNVDNKFSDHDPQTGGTNPDLWKSKIPAKKRSVVVCKQMTPMERFQKQLLSLFSCQSQPDESSREEVLLMDNVNNFIPRNEIGLGGILLKPADDTTPADEGSSTSASNNQ